MTKAQKLEAHGRRRRAGRGDRALHAGAVALGSGDVRAHGARRLAARRPKSGSAPTFCSATTAPATSRCCATLGARYGFKAEKIDPVRYKDFVVSSTRIRRLVSEGRVDEAGALLGHQYFLDGTVVRGDQRGRTIGFPTANLCTENELLPPHGVYATTARIGDVVHAVGDQHRHAADRRPVRAHRRSRPTSSISTRISTARRSASGSSSGCATSGRFESLDLLRAQIDADCAARARAVRSPFTVESRVVSDHDFFFALDVSGERRDDQMRGRAGAHGARPCRLRDVRDRRADRRSCAPRSPSGVADGKRRCDVQFRAAGGELEIVVVRRRRAPTGATTWPLPAS